MKRVILLLAVFVLVPQVQPRAGSLQMPTSGAAVAYRDQDGATARTRNYGASIDNGLGYTDALYGALIVHWVGMEDSLNAHAPGGWDVDSVVDSCYNDGTGPGPDDTVAWDYYPINVGYAWGEGDNDNVLADDDECSWNYRKHDTADWTGAIGSTELAGGDSAIGTGQRYDPGWISFTVTGVSADSLVSDWEGMVWQITRTDKAFSIVTFDSDDHGTTPYRRWIYYTPSAGGVATVIGPVQIGAGVTIGP